MARSSSATDVLGKEAQRLIDCNQKLKDLGVDDTIRLPQICVIGDQSAGKSSLIEAISKIQVPKADGCCTQCPIAITLTSATSISSQWTCTISIEERYDFVAENRSKKDSLLGPWQPKDAVKLTKLATIHDKSQLADLIRAAQVIVLDPECNPSLYLQNAEARKNARRVSQFSPNIIRLDIAEGVRPNLSFIDLPGVIANTAKASDRYLVGFVENLVRGYAEDDRSINLLALPMTSDIETSSACRIIQDLEVELRTLAVFTKPDCVSEEKQRHFVDRFLQHDEDQGDEKKLGFKEGYHFVSMCHQSIDDQATRRREAEFFNGTAWKHLAKEHRARLGVPALVEYLRKVLFQKTAQTLPDNLFAIQEQLKKVEQQLNEIPAPPDPTLVAITLQVKLSNLKASIEKMAIMSKPEWHTNATAFRDKIVTNMPTLALRTSQEKKQLRTARSTLRKLQNGEAADEMIDSGEPCTSATRVSHLNATGPMYNFSLEEIRDVNQQYRSAFVPGEIEPRAIEEMSKRSVKFWPDLLASFLEQCCKLLNQQIHSVVDEVMGQYRQFEFFTVIKDWLKQDMDNTTNIVQGIAQSLCQREQNLPYTLDQLCLKEKEASILADRRKARIEFRAGLVIAQLDATEGRTRKNREEAKECNLGADPYDIEIQMWSRVNAYYEVASSRFADNICHVIFCDLLTSCGPDMIERLTDHIGVCNVARHPQIVRWMTEDPEREAQRQRLNHQKHQLKEGYCYIQEVLGKDQASSSDTSSSKRPTSTMEADGASTDESPTKRTRLARRLEGLDTE